MLFNSFGFLFAYLPLVLAGYFLLGRLGRHGATGWRSLTPATWLALASMFFMPGGNGATCRCC